MTTTRLPKTITAGALLATPIPPVKWIIPGLLPAGLAIFAGPSKAGKSWLTLWLCLQISQGKSVWGREIEPRTVLYFSLEDTLGRLQERLYKLVDAEEDPERLILQTENRAPHRAIAAGAAWRGRRGAVAGDGHRRGCGGDRLPDGHLVCR